MHRRLLSFLILTCLGNVLVEPGLAQDDLLQLASRGETQTVLSSLEFQSSVDAMQADGTSLLHWAVYYDDAALVLRLLSLGADPALANDYGATPLSQAAVTGNPGIIRALLEAGADPDERSADDQTALMILARTDNLDAAQVLLDAGADVNAAESFRGQTALMWAAAQKRPQMLKLLLDHGADPNARSTPNNWPRQVSAEPRMKFLPSGGLTPLLYAAREGCTECVSYLLDAGADIHADDPEGITPLIMACLNAHWDSARLLVTAGAIINEWDIYGRSPLYATVDYNTVPHGGRPDKLSDDLTSNLEFMQMLLEGGANPNLQLKIFPPYRDLGADRVSRGDRFLLVAGATSLLRAARGADLEAIELLLRFHALIDLPNENATTPLMVAAGYGVGDADTRGRFRTEADALPATRLLLEHGASVNHQDNTGSTALHGAAQLGWSQMVSLLLEFGADASIEDATGSTPLDYALGRGGRYREGGGGPVFLETAVILESTLTLMSNP